MKKPWSKHVGVRPFSGRVFSEKRGGRWAVRYEWRVGGKRLARTFGPDTSENRDAAEKLLTAALARLQAREAGPPALTLGELLRTYREAAGTRLSSRTGKPLRPTTLDNYDEYHRTLRDACDVSRPAASLRKAEVVQLVDRLHARGWSAGTTARLIDHLHQVFKWAVVRELVPANPVEGVERGSRRGDGRAYTEDEAGKLVAALEERSHGDWRFRLVTTLEAAYGVRASQARHLRWDDVDLDAAWGDYTGTITFRQATQGSKGQPDRVVPMLQPVRMAILEALGHREDATPWVAWNWRDTQAPVSYDGMTRALHRLEKRARVQTVKGRAHHAFRRALATELARRLGIPQAAAWIGDTAGVIAAIYVKPNEADQAEAAPAAAARMATQ